MSDAEDTRHAAVWVHVRGLLALGGWRAIRRAELALAENADFMFGERVPTMRPEPESESDEAYRLADAEQWSEQQDRESLAYMHLRPALERSLNMLRALQWVNTTRCPTCGPEDRCPVCEASLYDAHDSDCELWALILELEALLAPTPV